MTDRCGHPRLPPPESPGHRSSTESRRPCGTANPSNARGATHPVDAQRDRRRGGPLYRCTTQQPRLDTPDDTSLHEREVLGSSLCKCTRADLTPTSLHNHALGSTCERARTPMPLMPQPMTNFRRWIRQTTARIASHRGLEHRPRRCSSRRGCFEASPLAAPGIPTTGARRRIS